VFAAIEEVRRESERLTFAEAMRRIADRGFRPWRRCTGSQEQLEGARAFAQKRRPVRKGY